MKNRLRKPPATDVVIVGAGASGATAAKVLTEAGFRVVGLERGPWLRPAQNFSGDEIKFVNRSYLWPDMKLSPRTYREDTSREARIFPFCPSVSLVGGGTVHWSGWMPRPMPSDFRQRSLHGEIDGATLADWPVTYDDLEPYLSKVEWEFGCSGLAAANRHEPPRSRDYPCPPLPPTRFGVKFYEGCAKLGLNAFPVPQAMITTAHKGRTPANWTGFWSQHGDPSMTRSSTLTTFVPEAVATGLYDLRPDCHVREISVSADGRAKSVIYIDADGREVEQEAQIIILCGGAIESARLLLLSTSGQFPEGLANSSGQVGRNATFHEYLFAVGLFDKEVDEPLNGFASHYVSGGCMDFYETDEGRGHIGGAIIGASSCGHPINWTCPSRPAWGLAAKDADREYFNHAMKIGIMVHDLPSEANRVDLDPCTRDAWDLPVARITHKPHPNDVQMAKWQVDKNMEILDAAGASTTIPVYLRGVTGNSTHQHGTTRMGTDPTTSVLNEWCRAHDVDNLYVLDGSSFPTALGVNPTLTIMANAWRCAARIAEEYRKGGELSAVTRAAL